MLDPGARLQGEIEYEYADGQQHLLLVDVGFLEADGTGEACVVIRGEVSGFQICEDEANLPVWRTIDLPVNYIGPEEPTTALWIQAWRGVIGVDNAGEQLIPIPGWWCMCGAGLPLPSIEDNEDETGPDGKYLRIQPFGEARVGTTIPEGATSLAYWRRVSSSALETRIAITVSNGEEGENNVEDYIAEIYGDLAYPGDWVKRVVDLTSCPPQFPDLEFTGDCEEVFVNIYAGEDYIDFAFATSSDSDNDGDGIYDDWEENGVFAEGPRFANFIDLPAMGADPEKPDIFVHLEYMQDLTYNQRLSDEALERVVEAFADSPYESPTESVGINLHIDQGPASPLDFGEETVWGDLSRVGTPLYKQGFESGIMGWWPYCDCNLERSTAQTHSGSASGKMTTADGVMAIEYYLWPVSATFYDLTIWVYVPSTYSGTDLQIRIADDSDSDTTAVNMATRDAWQEVMITDFESTGVDLFVALYEDGSPADVGDFIYFDDVAVTTGPVDWVEVLGTFVDDDPEEDYIWDEFDQVRSFNFLSSGRERIFHYALAAHKFGLDTNDSSGIARGIGSADFIVSLGGFFGGIGLETEQAGVFMHELGHNLGLRHGGDISVNNKPNYLSVMNYLFNLSGVLKDGGPVFDHSRAVLDPLDESNLEEWVGLGSEASGYGTAYYCSSVRKDVEEADEPINWNCNTTGSPPEPVIDVFPVAEDLNDNGSYADYLEGWNDWSFIIFDGGAIAGLGIQAPPSRVLGRILGDGVEVHSDVTYEYAREHRLIDVARYEEAERQRQ